MPPRQWDHPRVCGEKLVVKLPPLTKRGSPPRMRGKVCKNCTSFLHFRITPAYAGKSLSPSNRLARQMDHPRVCGEKPEASSSTLRVTGSPPRMRGKANQIIGTLQQKGITPAYAGKSCCLSRKACPAWDHPRVCGEKFTSADVARSSIGSPPRMRGKETAPVSPIGVSGITPAYAGKSTYQH